MDYDQTLAYLFHKLPMFSRVGAEAFKKDLTNTLKLCQAIGNPQQKFKTIHIAGTNGKGSVSHLIASVLQTAGYKTGLYTSPHLKDFRERVKVNGKTCEEGFVIDFTEKIKDLIEEIEPSFFEITVAMAFEYFAMQQVDVAVIEVGLGGRFDSTNIITPELSVITNIGWDHANMLGNSLEKIAFEKAGIIKKNVPVVIGETLPETKTIFANIAAEKNAPISFAREKRWLVDYSYEHHQLQVTIADKHNEERKNYTLDLPGFYQTKNIITALEAIQHLQLQGWEILSDDIFIGISTAKKLTGLHGRWENIHQNPSVILDVGHNEDGIKQIVQQLELLTFHQLHIIIGMVRDKEIEKLLLLLPKSAQYYFTRSQIPRALPENELAEKAAVAGLKGQMFPDVNAALQVALGNAAKDDLILVCGSVFLVGEVEAMNKKN